MAMRAALTRISTGTTLPAPLPRPRTASTTAVGIQRHSALHIAGNDPNARLLPLMGGFTRSRRWRCSAGLFRKASGILSAALKVRPTMRSLTRTRCFVPCGCVNASWVGDS